MADHSFDITSKIDAQELDNAVNQANKEINTRYDLKDTNTIITFNRNENRLTITSANDYALQSTMSILREKLIKRNISPKVLIEKPVIKATGDTVKLEIDLQQGIPMEKAKDIVKDIKSTKIKVQCQIQGDQVRITSKKIDDLQTVMNQIKEKDYGIHMQFTNYR